MRDHRPFPVRTVTCSALLGGAFVLCAACGTSTTAPTGPSSSPTSSGTSNAAGGGGGSPSVEVNPAGDIPDNQAYVRFGVASTATAKGYSLAVPEGWARSATAATIRFSDKYNSITVIEQAAASAPTAATASSTELPRLRSTIKGYSAGAVSVVHRRSGPAVLITYRGLSAVNPVTGKVAHEAVERYEVWRAGHEVVITLAAPVGSDNVDPWRKVTDSFAWAAR